MISCKVVLVILADSSLALQARIKDTSQLSTSISLFNSYICTYYWP